MKNVIIAFMLMISVLSFAQDKSNKKFQFGISYSLTNDHELYKKPLSFYANYQVKKLDKIDINAGLKVFYFGSKESENFTSKIGFNPNASASYYFAKNKLNANIAIGYYFDNATFKPTPYIFFPSQNQSIKTSGLTFAPGLKYFVHPNIFVDTNLTIILAKTKYESGTSESNNNAYFNIGAGVAF